MRLPFVLGFLTGLAACLAGVGPAERLPDAMAPAVEDQGLPAPRVLRETRFIDHNHLSAPPASVRA